MLSDAPSTCASSRHVITWAWIREYPAGQSAKERTSLLDLEKSERPCESNISSHGQLFCCTAVGAQMCSGSQRTHSPVPVYVKLPSDQQTWSPASSSVTLALVLHFLQKAIGPAPSSGSCCRSWPSLWPGACNTQRKRCCGLECAPRPHYRVSSSFAVGIRKCIDAARDLHWFRALILLVRESMRRKPCSFCGISGKRP